MDVRDERERQLSAQSASGGLEAHQDSTGNRVPSAFGRRREVDIPGDEEMTLCFGVNSPASGDVDTHVISNCSGRH